LQNLSPLEKNVVTVSLLIQRLPLAIFYLFNSSLPGWYLRYYGYHLRGKALKRAAGNTNRPSNWHPYHPVLELFFSLSVLLLYLCQTIDGRTI